MKLQVSATDLCFALLLSVSVGQAATYHVAPRGRDENPGSRDLPWASPGYASRQLQPGDTLILQSGRYVLSRFDEDILIPPSGTSNAWVTVRGEGPSRPILAARDNLLAAVLLNGASCVRIENLEITHDDEASGDGRLCRDGIQAFDQPIRHVVLYNLHIHHVDEFGLNMQDAEDVSIVDCQIEYCGFGAIGGPEGIEGGWRRVRIDGCRLSYSGHYYQGGDGTDRPYDRPDGFGIEPSDGPVEIVDTLAEHNRGDGLDSKAANTLIQRCVVANNSCDGVKLWGTGSKIENTVVYGRGDDDPAPSPWSAIVIHSRLTGATFSIVNVTVDDFLGGNYLVHVQYDDAFPVAVTIRNSIFRATGDNSALWFRDSVTLVAENNLFFSPSTDIVVVHGTLQYGAGDLAALGAGNRYGEPRFVAPAWGTTGNYHLQPDSPAVGRADDNYSPSIDLEGRIRDSEPDLGAFEFGGMLLAPRLELKLADGQVQLWWTNPSPRFRLESCSGLGEPWFVVPDSPFGLNHVFQIQVVPPDRMWFFRLAKARDGF